jgi:hypothetical protein
MLWKTYRGNGDIAPCILNLDTDQIIPGDNASDLYALDMR